MVKVAGALQGPPAVNETVYEPGAEKVCVAFTVVAVFDAPLAGSPKFQAKLSGQRVVMPAKES